MKFQWNYYNFYKSLNIHRFQWFPNLRISFKKTQIVFSIMGEIQNMKTTLALTLTYLSNK